MNKTNEELPTGVTVETTLFYLRFFRTKREAALRMTNILLENLYGFEITDDPNVDMLNEHLEELVKVYIRIEAQREIAHVREIKELITNFCEADNVLNLIQYHHHLIIIKP